MANEGWFALAFGEDPPRTIRTIVAASRTTQVTIPFAQGSCRLIYLKYASRGLKNLRLVFPEALWIPQGALGTPPPFLGALQDPANRSLAASTYLEC